MGLEVTDRECVGQMAVATNGRMEKGGRRVDLDLGLDLAQVKRRAKVGSKRN